MSEFLWGVATSAYQSEGGYNGADQPQTNWAAGERKGDVAKSGVGPDFWHRYPEDFARCRELGLNAFRLGMEWSRVQPTYVDRKAPPPPFDYHALDHYVEMLADCRQNGLEPLVTLHHFVHPSWLGPDPWLEPDITELFCRYVRETVLYVNRALTDRHGLPPIQYYISINEPNMFVLNTYFGTQFPGRSKRMQGMRTLLAAYRSILIAHVSAYNLVHHVYADQGWPEPSITLNNYCSDLYWSDKILLDLLSVRERGVRVSNLRDYIVGKITEFEQAFEAAAIPLKKDLPYFVGAALKRVSDWLGHKTFMPEFFAPLVDYLYAADKETSFDYLGLDYYDPFAAHMFRHPVWWDHEFKDKSLRSWLMNSVTSKWWDWRVLPSGMHFFCDYYSRDFGNRQVLIAENGMAVRRRVDNRNTLRRDRMTRSDFLRVHINEIVNIARSDIPLIGYLHWSLFDNYEWGTFTPRFGLYSINYAEGNNRLVEDQTGDRPSETYAALIENAREQFRLATDAANEA
jgi:beta-glucosidase/6-phospho-beta-glucosidase/beta-galactosidase